MKTREGIAGTFVTLSTQLHPDDGNAYIPQGRLKDQVFAMLLYFLCFYDQYVNSKYLVNTHSFLSVRDAGHGLQCHFV